MPAATPSPARSKARTSRARERYGAAIWRSSPTSWARRICRASIGGILFLEDIGEHPYRVERMLHQLRFAGILERQRAVVLGTFNGFDPTPNDNGYDFAAMLAHVRAHCATPIVTGLPFGHCRDKLTLPVGGRCALAVRAGIGEIALTDSATPGRPPPLRRAHRRLAG